MHMNHSDSILAASFFDTGALKLLLEGGIFMWPLLALLILAIAVIIERYRSLKLLETDASELREKVTTLLSEDKVEESSNSATLLEDPCPPCFPADCVNTSSCAASTTIRRRWNNR